MINMSKNKRNFFIGEIGSAIIFFTGVLFILIPNVYGLISSTEIAVNDLFLSMSLIIACVYFGFFYTIKNNPTRESVYLCIAASLCGIINIALSNFLSESLTLALSILVLTASSSIIRVFTVKYYYDKKDGYYYIAGLLTGLYFISGILISISLFDDPLIQTIELGFLLIIHGGIESINVATKALLKAPRFLGKIKF